MSNRNFPKPSDGELKILQVLWNQGPLSVRSVHETLSQDREVGYTTTLKIMQIMAEKGLVNRNTESRTHIYEAAVQEDEIQSRLLNQFVSNAFQGSAMKMVMQALGNHKASPEELDEIKALIRKIEEDE
ncbi:MAG: BlaI/MecI/CopY family transcriptional regulator [Bacteroidota bacterium]